MYYYTYILQSMNDMNFYTGYTKDLKLRFEQHNKGLVKSTKERRPFRLIYYEACLNQNDAIKREKYLKSYHGKMFPGEFRFRLIRSTRLMFGSTPSLIISQD